MAQPVGYNTVMAHQRIAAEDFNAANQPQGAKTPPAKSVGQVLSDTPRPILKPFPPIKFALSAIDPLALPETS